MTFSKKILTASFYVTLVLCFTSGAHAAEKKQRRQDTVLFQLKENASPENLQKLQIVLDQHQFVQERKLLHGKMKQIKALGNLKKLSEEELAALILSSGAADFAEPDYLVSPTLMPNDPKFGSQWHHAKIGSQSAWDITTGHDSIRVVVCDSGIESTHPDLSQNLILPGYNSVDGSTSTEPVNHHGTLVAGTIGGTGSNGLGVAGLNWNVSILPGKISNTSDGWAYFSDMAECVRWGADSGAKVINLSYGAGDSSAVASAAQYLRDRGGLLFVSAGNDSIDVVAYPDFDSFVLVGATNSSDVKTSWSNYGTAVDIVAPGENIVTTTLNGSYANAYGTSFSSPVTAGVAALIYAVNPSFSAAEVEGILFSTAKDIGALGEDNVYGFGRVDAGAAVAKAAAATVNAKPVAKASASTLAGVAPLAIDFSGSGSYDVDGNIISYNWNFGDGTLGSGLSVAHVFQNAGTFVVSVTVKDDYGATSTDSLTVVVKAPLLGTIHASAISLASQLSGKNQYKAVATVRVVDQNGQPRAGVSVSGSFSGVINGSASATTDSNGVATITSANTRSTGSVTFALVNMSVTSYEYDSSANVVSATTATVGGTSDSTTSSPKGRK